MKLWKWTMHGLNGKRLASLAVHLPVQGPGCDPWSDSWDPEKAQPTQQSTCCLGSITEDKSSESEINQLPSLNNRKERKTEKKEKEQIRRHLCENSRNANICTIRSQRREERGWGWEDLNKECLKTSQHSKKYKPTASRRRAEEQQKNL